MKLRTQAEPSGSSKWMLIVFSAMVGIYCLWILSMPVFPSQDGPLHLYYTRIFGLFLAHTPGVYGQYYKIRSYLPPYALYYYLLLALNRLVSLTTADKIVVCCSVVLNAFGLRYLARRIGRGGDVAAFLFLPLLLNWPLVMGFVNFTLSNGLGLFAAGLWARFDDGHTRLRQLAFAVLLPVMTLTHPLPLLVLLIGCSVDVIQRFVRSRTEAPVGARVQALLPRILCLAVSIPCAIYIRSFTLPNIMKQDRPSNSFVRRVLHDTGLFMRGQGLFAFTGDASYVLVYRFGVYVLIFAAFCLAARHALRCWRARTLDTPSIWFVVAVISVLGLPCLPHDMNASHYIAERFALMVYMFIAIAASGMRPSSDRAVKGLIAGSLLLSVFGLAIGWVRVGTAAKRVAVLTEPGHGTPGSMGVLLQVGPLEKRDFTFQPFMWAGTHYFRVNNLVMYNSPWLDSPQIPLERNKQTNLLEASEQQRAPSNEVPDALYQPGQRWDPASASFFMVEQTTPKLRPGPHPEAWQELHVPVPELDLSVCDPKQWFCIAPRK